MSPEDRRLKILDHIVYFGGRKYFNSKDERLMRCLGDNLWVYHSEPTSAFETSQHPYYNMCSDSVTIEQRTRLLGCEILFRQGFGDCSSLSQYFGPRTATVSSEIPLFYYTYRSGRQQVLMFYEHMWNGKHEDRITILATSETFFTQLYTILG